MNTTPERPKVSPAIFPQTWPRLPAPLDNVVYDPNAFDRYFTIADVVIEPKDDLDQTIVFTLVAKADVTYLEIQSYFLRNKAQFYSSKAGFDKPSGNYLIRYDDPTLRATGTIKKNNAIEVWLYLFNPNSVLKDDATKMLVE